MEKFSGKPTEGKFRLQDQITTIMLDDQVQKVIEIRYHEEERIFDASELFNSRGETDYGACFEWIDGMELLVSEMWARGDITISQSRTFIPVSSLH